MAVPEHFALPNFNGNFSLNNELSDSQDRIQALQGVPYALRKVFGLAKVKLNIVVEPINANDDKSNYRFIIKSSILGLGVIGAAPLKAVGFQTENTDERVMDGSDLEKTEPVIGKTKSRIWLSTVEDLLNGKDSAQTDEFLKQGWEGCEPGKTDAVRISILSANPDKEAWRNEQVWGIQQGRWTARIAFTKGDVRETARLVYDFEA